ncbi:MAG: hypothetical protein ACLQMF_12530 [Rectinemataceae bacterium]
MRTKSASAPAQVIVRANPALLVSALCILCAFLASAQDSAAGTQALQAVGQTPYLTGTGSTTMGASTVTSSAVTLSIRFFDKRIYFPESEIPIKVTIANEGDSTYRFRLADDKIYSLTFEARTPTNRLLDASDSYKLALGESKPVLYRELAIKPGEEYSFIERLERYVHIDGPGTYTVTAGFYPGLVGSDAPPAVVSNILLLSVRPSPGLPPALDMINQETGEALKAEALPPDEVVRRTIVARQKGLWNQFFLYLDLEALLTRNPDQRTIYDRQSDAGQRRMIARFRDDLQSDVVDKDIVVQPYDFEIIETNYTPYRGTVRVLEKFQDHQLRLVKEYTYQLERRDGVWYIVGYTVLNKGVE